MRSREFVRTVALPTLAVFALGNAACSAAEESDQSTKPAGSSAPAVVIFEPKPKDLAPLKQVTPDAEGRQTAWSPTNPQPWLTGREVQIDSRATKPVGGPVGVFAEPRQDAAIKTGEVRDGEEYPAVCYTDDQDGAQFVQNDNRDGSSVWLQLDVDRNGAADVLIPVVNVGFTGLNAQGQPDGTLPKC